jgi:hypothetical protein
MFWTTEVMAVLLIGIPALTLGVFAVYWIVRRAVRDAGRDGRS